MKKVVAINASPRRVWNTASLVRAAAYGASEAGCEVSVYDLYTIGKYSGCVSCFGCKTTMPGMRHMSREVSIVR